MKKRQGSRTPHCSLQGDRLPPRRAAVVFTAAETSVVLLVELGHLTLQRAARLRSCCALEGGPHSDGDDDQARWTSRLDHWGGRCGRRDGSSWSLSHFLDCLRWPHKQTPYPPSSVCFQRAHPSTCATSKLSLRQGPWASPHSEGMDSGDGPAAVRRGRLGSIWLCGAEIQG